MEDFVKSASERNVIATAIFGILAFACMIYGIYVWSAKSGTGFYIVWLGLGVCFFVLGLGVYFGVWAMLPLIIKRGIIFVVVVFGMIFLFVEGCIFSQFSAKGKPELDYIIVLGAQVREGGPSLVLRYRLDAAITYLNENPNTICIVSGGQGKNEPYAEAEGMAKYLAEKGIPESRILKETESKTTEQNIQFSQKYMKKDATTGIVTNNFHVFRALQIAKKEGLSNVCGIAADAKKQYLPNNMLREFFAEVKFLIKR